MWPIDQLVMVGWACCRSRMAASGHLAPCRTSPPRWACTRRPDPLDSQLLYLGQLRFIVVHWFEKMKKYHSSLALDHGAAMQIIATPKLLAHLSDLSASRIKFSADFDLGVSVLYHFIGASKVGKSLRKTKKRIRNLLMKVCWTFRKEESFWQTRPLVDSSAQIESRRIQSWVEWGSLLGCVHFFSRWSKENSWPRLRWALSRRNSN